MRPRGANGICYDGGVAAFPPFPTATATAAKPTVTFPTIQYSLESNLHRTKPPLHNLTVG